MKEDKESLRLNGEEIRRGFIGQVITQTKKMKSKDWICLVLLIFSLIPGKVWKLFNHHIWVISEYEHLARDNGYWFFRYVREQFPEKTVYYPISDISPDKKKIDSIGHGVRFSSFKHFLLFWASEKQFTSSKNAGFPSRICEDLVQWNFHGFQYVMLNHGITKGKSTVVDATKTNYDYICTCSNLDKKIIIDDNGQNPENVVVTGFARHDNLDNNIVENNLILIMPTWRSWLNYKRGNNENKTKEIVHSFINSRYYKRYLELLKSPELSEFIEENDLSVVFYLHDYAQYYSRFFNCGNKRICIGRSEQYDIQDLLKRASILITDYSSVCYDFAYMYKPVIYYQFDKEEFEYYQYKAGDNYTYEQDGVGEVCTEYKDVITIIKKYHADGFKMPKKYKRRVEKYFAYHDKDNCKRIYEMFCSK